MIDGEMRRGDEGSSVETVVVGAGVIGLTSAIRLAEAGVPTEVLTAHEPSRTTSYAAGASWGPHLIGTQTEVMVWAERTLAVHRAMAGDPATGVRIGTGVEASREPVAVPPWAAPLGEVELVGPEALPPGFVSGWRHRTPLIDMPVHLRYLRQRYLDLGGRITHRRIASLDEVAAETVVNCTGMGARELVPDPSLTPIRGQVVICANPGLTEFFVEDSPHGDLTYLFPHGDVLLLGGQALRGDERAEPDPDAAADIVRRTSAIDPRIASAPILEHRVGFRPSRPEVRLEAEDSGGRRIVHHYGHGGSGVTLSWGCADDVVALVRATTSG